MWFILVNMETQAYYVHDTNSWQAGTSGATIFNLSDALDAIEQFQMFDEMNIYPILCFWLTEDKEQTE